MAVSNKKVEIVAGPVIVAVYAFGHRVGLLAVYDTLSMKSGNAGPVDGYNAIGSQTLSDMVIGVEAFITVAEHPVGAVKACRTKLLGETS